MTGADPPAATAEPGLAGRARRDGLAEIDGATHYVIDGVEEMAPFLMSVVSDGDRWMFVSSSGALTAGRRDANTALFPYVTDDRLHGAAGQIGPVTRLRVRGGSGDDVVAWRPFTERPGPHVRTIAKSVVGDSVLFEERHGSLGLVVRSRWATSGEFGFVRATTVANESTTARRIDLLDGLVDVMPFGLEPAHYQRFSNLTQAYKRSEVIDAATRLAVYSLEAPISDRAEPAEVLRATTVWSYGLDGDVSVDAGALTAFDAGRVVVPVHLATGVPGAYLIAGELELAPGEHRTWTIVADVGRDHADVVDLRHRLRHDTALADQVERDVLRTRHRLAEIMASADAIQCTGDERAGAHHVANVTYNVMRGGVPLDGYALDSADVARFVAERNRTVATRHADWLAALPARIGRADLDERVRARVARTGDVHLARIVTSYLPFGFSRRHGDPSRPWNVFSIRVTDESGAPVVHYEGNWRDVFQNWEALCASFPEFLPGAVSTFLDASTPDGHNPYRITRDGIDWEVPDPDDPWANIGYWGDHQVVYLLRLLEASDRYLPGEVARRLADRVHTYADVPYRIAPHDELVADPKSTIHFDAQAHERALRRVAEVGGDGRLLHDRDGEIVVVTMLEKLLVVALAKLGGFVAGGGIWMNTQRPEWNDANNALVGRGLSMVTLFHLRRYLAHVRDLVTEWTSGPAAPPSSGPVAPVSSADTVPVSGEVATWLGEVRDALASVAPATARSSDAARRALLDRLGRAATRYRAAVVADGFGGDVVALPAAEVVAWCDAAIEHLDDTIAAARRPDGLVHSYNVMVGLDGVGLDAVGLDGGIASVEQLPVMLEGQAAALSCGCLDPRESIELLDALFASDLYRPDQRSFMLAPADRPPAFVDKNRLDPAHVDADPLLAGLVAGGDRSILRRDRDGTLRFAPDLVDEAALGRRLDQLADEPRWASLVDQHRRAVLDTYDTVFGHRASLGRSRSMYAYEGIGSIYWHMVAKLLLAVQETATAAADAGADAAIVDRLVAAYQRIRDGLGGGKTAAEFGAIPIDPHSHSPAHAGAQQPGMTGAVKEEILARPGELGVRVERGEIRFDGRFLRDAELLDRPASWSYLDVDRRWATVELAPGSLGFTLCQVPIVVSVTDGAARVEVDLADGRTLRSHADRLDRRLSAAVFGRTGEVRQVRAAVARPDLQRDDLQRV